MPHHVRANGNGTGVTHTAQQLCLLLQGQIGGAVVPPPAAFGFPPLGGGAANNLLTNQSAAQPLNGTAAVTRSVGLMTCASVIWAGPGGAYVHHANAGVIPAGEVLAGIAQTGGAAGATFAVYAYNGPQDPARAPELAKLTGSGIPANNVVEISNLAMAMFGINGLGWLGH